MKPPFDIFRMLPVDRALWRGTATSVEEAQERIREFAGNSSGKYLILCLQTGIGLVVNTDDVNADDINAGNLDSAATAERAGSAPS
jgi:hypothetical protein